MVIIFIFKTDLLIKNLHKYFKYFVSIYLGNIISDTGIGLIQTIAPNYADILTHHCLLKPGCYIIQLGLIPLSIFTIDQLNNLKYKNFSEKILLSLNSI